MRRLNDVLLFILIATSASISRAAEPINLATRRELFVDHHIIDRLDGARLQLHRPVRRNIALKLDQPWEGVYCGYFTVIRDDSIRSGKKFRMYYRGLPANAKGEADHSRGEVTCVAESADGITFTRPKLGLYESGGSKDNNIILAGNPACHNFSPFLDTRPGVPAKERYKAVGGNRRTGLLPFVSADGLHWKPLRKEPIITGGAFDSQNVVFWSPAEKLYVSYYRVFRQGKRSIARTTSKDFLNWSKPLDMSYGDTPREHLYTNQTHPYFRAPHIYISLPKRFAPGRKAHRPEHDGPLVISKTYAGDVSEGVLMTTRGGDRYDRTFMEAFFRPGRDPANWVSRTNMAALNVVPTAPDEMSIYYSQHYAQPTHHILRTTLRTDGFASLRAGYRGGELLTKPFKFAGKQLEINFATSAVGSVRIELQDPSGKPLAGFALADCNETVGDRIRHVVRWKAGNDLSKIAGQTIRMRIVLKDADVYAFRFATSDDD